MGEYIVKITFIPVVVWVIIVALFALFVLSVALIQVNVQFSDEALSREKQDKISGEVFSNLPTLLGFIGLIFVLAIIGFYGLAVRVREVKVSSEPGELVG
ncbi:MAG: hypothetical protein QXR02_06860 [Acidilobaceae archaeon]